MLNAVTALEGLLPILPVEAVRQQVITARQVLVQAAVLAEAPSLSAAAAGGPAEETQPSLLVDMLLSPLHHPLATPQLRDRLAGLLLQVQPFHTVPTAVFCWHQAEWEHALTSLSFRLYSARLTDSQFGCGMSSVRPFFPARRYLLLLANFVHRPLNCLKSRQDNDVGICRHPR